MAAFEVERARRETQMAARPVSPSSSLALVTCTAEAPWAVPSKSKKRVKDTNAALLRSPQIRSCACIALARVFRNLQKRQVLSSFWRWQYAACQVASADLSFECLRLEAPATRTSPRAGLKYAVRCEQLMYRCLVDLSIRMHRTKADAFRTISRNAVCSRMEAASRHAARVHYERSRSLELRGRARLQGAECVARALDRVQRRVKANVWRALACYAEHGLAESMLVRSLFPGDGVGWARDTSLLKNLGKTSRLPEAMHELSGGSQQLAGEHEQLDGSWYPRLNSEVWTKLDASVPSMPCSMSSQGFLGQAKSPEGGPWMSPLEIFAPT